MDRIKLPEETSYAIITMPKGDIKKRMIEYIIRSRASKELGFEFIYGKTVKPVFIVDGEGDIPLVRFPIVVETNNVSYVVSNLVGSLKSEFIDDSILKAKRSDYVDFETMRNVLVYNTLAKQDMDSIATYTAQLATMWISKTIKNHMRLDVNVSSDVEGALFIYFIRQYISGVTNAEIKTKMNNFLTGKWRVANEVIDDVLARLDTANLDMGEYVRIIANDHPATSKMDTSLINSFISSNWYSGADSSNIQIFIATENLHTMASIFYHCMETPTGKKSVLGRLLIDHKRISRLDDLIDGLKQTYKARQI